MNIDLLVLVIFILILFISYILLNFKLEVHFKSTLEKKDNYKIVDEIEKFKRMF